MSDGREGGFIVLHRRIKSWPVYRAMNAEQRQVVTEMLLAARWEDEPGEFWFGPHRFAVPRGCYFMSEDALAEEAGTTRKVVRTVYKKLLTEGFIVRRAVHSSGQCPNLITILNYDKYQSLPDKRANGRAKEGPETGQRRASKEPVEPVEPVLLSDALRAPAPNGAPTQGADLFPAPPPATANGAAQAPGRAGNGRAAPAPKDPRHQEFIARAFQTATELGNPEPDVADGKSLAQLKAFLSRKKSVTAEVWDVRWRRLLADPRAPHKIWALIDRWDNLAGPSPPANGTATRHVQALTPAPAEAFGDGGFVKIR